MERNYLSPTNFIAKCYRFDAWGHRSNPSNWSQWDNGTRYITDRGFTGHLREAHVLLGKAAAKYEADPIPPADCGGKHTDLFGLINMSSEVRSRTLFMSGNGRIYDPGLGRFLSSDPYVQMPDNSQNFNRYSYALNNPLVYTDPSGEWLWIPMVIGAYFGGKAANDGEWNLFKWDFDGETLLGVGIGGALGYFTGYAGAKSGLNLAATMGAPGFGMTSGMVSGAVYSGISSDWNPAAMFMGAWSGGMVGGVSGLAMSGLGAAWDGISFGHTGTIGDAVRKCLGGLPGLTYRDWSMSQVIWTGFNLPSTGTMLANTSMLVNGALHGQWGSKLVPIGRVTNTTAFMGMGVTDAATWYNLSGGTQLNMNVTARTINSFYKNMGWNTNHIKVLSLSGVSGNYNAHGTLSRFSLAGQGHVTTSGKGSFPWTKVNGAYPLSIATLEGPQSPDIPSFRLTHRVRLYERYGEFAPVPWWRRVFFGF